jgi:hypothetical protein
LIWFGFGFGFSLVLLLLLWFFPLALLGSLILMRRRLTMTSKSKLLNDVIIPFF